MSTTGLVTTLCVTGTLAAAAIVTRPAWLQAGTSEALEATPARVAAHRDLMDVLGRLLSRSRAVLDVHERGPTPYLEIVLWLQDAENLGHPDPEEIAVISHSEVLETIVYHALEPDTDAPATLPAVFDADFCRTWRERDDVTRRLLATGVTGMQVEPSGRQGDRATLRISLTWGEPTSDGADDGSMLLDVALEERSNPW
ncbi:MAG: hypothetical protein ACYTGP_06680 [Planctomycetota bacterium]|jgi:hypothetical protein